MPVRTLLENPYLAITLDEEAGLVRVVRFEAPFATPEEAVRIMEPALVVAGQVSGSGRRLLFDVRRGPGRNDPEFENALRPLYARHFPGFARMAVLTRTAVGKLQVQRVARGVGGDPSGVFLSEEEALAYLREPQ